MASTTPFLWYYAGSARGDVSSRFSDEKYLHIRYQLGDILLINCGYSCARAKLALALPRLGGQYVACECMTSLDLAGTGFLEALGSAAIGLDLGHHFLLG